MELLEQILSCGNLNAAYLAVYRNKGAAGADGVTVDEMKEHLKMHKEEILRAIRVTLNGSSIQSTTAKCRS